MRRMQRQAPGSFPLAARSDTVVIGVGALFVCVEVFHRFVVPLDVEFADGPTDDSRPQNASIATISRNQ
jgi:hypothetical protein